MLLLKCVRPDHTWFLYSKISTRERTYTVNVFVCHDCCRVRREGYGLRNMISDYGCDFKHEHMLHLCGVYGYARTIHDFLRHCFCFWLCFVMWFLFLFGCLLFVFSSLAGLMYLLFVFSLLCSFFIFPFLLSVVLYNIACPSILSLLYKPKWLTPYAWTQSTFSSTKTSIVHSVKAFCNLHRDHWCTVS